MALLAAIAVALALNGAYGGLPEVLAHRVALHPQNSLIAEVRITLSGQGQVFIEYENPAAGKFVTALSEPGTEHTIPVVRLRPETAYAYTIGIQAGHGGRAYGPSGEFTAGPLPPELAGRWVRTVGRSSQPLIAADYKDGQNVYYFLWDETGHIVWYYKVENPENLENLQWAQSIKQKPDGNLVFISNLCCLVEITPLGEVVDWLAPNLRQGRPHHDFRLLDGGGILYPGMTRTAVPSGGRAGRRAGGPTNGQDAAPPAALDRLHIWHPADGRIEAVWNSGDFQDLSEPPQGAEPSENMHWTRINSLSFGADGRLILSFPNRHQIMALSPDFRRIEWRLGGPDSDYAFPHPADRFYGQHTAAQLPNGNILLFDNGDGRPDSEGGAYSRALELRLDAASGTAVKAWEYRPDPDLYADFISSAFRLGNGHTLVNFGVNSPTPSALAPLTVVEVNRPGDVVFRLETANPYAGRERYPRSFRAAAEITSIMGEIMLRPPAERPQRGPFHPDWPMQELAARRAAAQVPFGLQQRGDRLIYRKQPCVPEDVVFAFWLHLYPENPAALPEGSREYGFENRDFRFEEWGVIADGECRAEVPLPEYPITRLRTGQYIVGYGRLWEAELPGPAAAPAE